MRREEDFRVREEFRDSSLMLSRWVIREDEGNEVSRMVTQLLHAVSDCADRLLIRISVWRRVAQVDHRGDRTGAFLAGGWSGGRMGRPKQGP